MEFIELAITNFKKFADERWRFCPGLNLLWGPNESGKSTIHEAICCALFGRERGKSVESWSGGHSAVRLAFRSGDAEFCLDRKLTEGTASIGTVRDGGLADVVSKKDEINALLADILGFSSRTIFDSTVSVKQLSVSRSGTSDMEAVGAEIQRVFTGTAHISVAEVIRRLESRRDMIKGRARPSNPREYDKITDRLGRIAEELADARRSRDQIRNLEDERVGLEERIAREEERIDTLEALLDRHKRWTELRRKEAEADDSHKSVFGRLKRIDDTLAELTSIQSKLEGYTNLVEKDDEISEHLLKIEAKRAELSSRLAEMESAGNKSRISFGYVPRILMTLFILCGLGGIALGFGIDRRAFLALIPATVFGIAYMRMRRSSGSRHIDALTESMRGDLDQSAAEESSILSYMGCDSTEKALNRIKEYRRLAARARELDVSLSAMLDGKSQSDWQAHESELARELSGIRREMSSEFDGYSPPTEESESWRTEFAALQFSLPRAQARLHEILGALESEYRNARDHAALEGELEFLHRRRDELEFLHKAYEEAISVLSCITQSVSEEYLPALSQKAGGYLMRMTSGRYTTLCVKPGWEITLDCIDRSAVPPSALSVGTLDQLHFSLRIVCGELLSAGRKLPIVLDDPFASFDRGRTDKVLDLLQVLAEDNQILVLTHDPYVLDWARGLSASGSVPCTISELSPPTGASVSS
jgi:uncharacterized protein YhaN